MAGTVMRGVREGRRIQIRGTVQGVGFRPWVYRLAREQGLGGRVRNDAGGVTIEAYGSPAALGKLVELLEASPPPAAHITQLATQPIPPEWDGEFRIVESGASGERRVSIPADLATCSECAAEILDPGDRRHRHPFANCTSCGPRFTIARDAPYDRGATSMAGFPMCPRCREEYERPEDRRFHAQPNSCPDCGPRLELLGADGAAQAVPDPLEAVVGGLRDGLIVALKGIGGYHLACDATSGPAVRRLRERKRRDEKPFAVMVRDLARARREASFGEREERLLASPECPIVIVARGSESSIVSDVAPQNPTLGLLLPYSPLHHLLLAGVDRPLVMTSGNLSEEPMAYRDAEAVERLGGVADLFLTHDRPIETRTDDSVARVIAGRPVVFRRSRGYVPRPVPLSRPFTRPVLACGAQLKNTFCLGSTDAAWLGPHIGDLDDPLTLEALGDGVSRLERFLGVRPEVVAHDLHPDYLSTTYALERPETTKVAVQHHHAHVASAMAEHGLEGPVLGVAYDGTGYGTDGTAWGGEILLARYEGFERVATLRPLRLAGGDVAIREVWRLALALVDDAWEGEAAAPLDAFALFDEGGVAERDVAVVRRMIGRGLNAPLAHGVGRYFDAVGALALGRGRSRFESQVALEWNLVADPGEPGRYEYALELEAQPWELDLRPMVREIAGDLRGGVSPAVISGRFHNTLVAGTAELLRRVGRQAGKLPVVLSGGCFQNALLAEKLLGILTPEHRVVLHGEVPPGDGGLALGQAVVADAVCRSDGGR